MVALEGKVAIVTGAASGMGAAQARLFAELGARVVVADRDEERGSAVAAELGDAGFFCLLDVTDADGWARLVVATTQRFGSPDILVNNAGVYQTVDLDDASAAELLHRVLNVNLVGPILGMAAVAPEMNAGGSIVNLASISGVRGHPGAVAYSSSKWGVRGASRSAALELAPQGIRVNCVCPGAVDTPMISGSTMDLSTLPMPRRGTVDEVADLVAFLASDAGSYCTGAEFVIDGGATA